jgi:hypothetical protein
LQSGDRMNSNECYAKSLELNPLDADAKEKALGPAGPSK